MHRGFAPIIVIAIIAAFLIGIGATVAYFKFQSKSASNQPALTSPSPVTAPRNDLSSEAFSKETVDWKTYADQNFSVKIPSDWNIYKQSDYVQLTNYDLNTAPGRGFNPIEDKGLLKVEVYTKETNRSLDDYANSLQQNEQPPETEQTITSINNYPAIKIKAGPPRISSYAVKHPSKNIIITINFFLDFGNYEKLQDQILSTFKFL